MKPLALKPNDTVAIVAPADRPREPSELQTAASWLQAQGWHVKMGGHVLGRHGYLAGADAERLDDFHGAWADDEVRAIFCARGTWGASRLLSLLDFDMIAAHPKIFVGCGDISALLVALHARTGLVTFHGPNLDRLSSSQETRTHLLRALTSVEAIGQVPVAGNGATAADAWPAPTLTLRGGSAQGRLIGGSLRALVGLQGTPYRFEPRGKLLFLEERDQRFSQFDRDLTTLRLSGITDQVNGLLIGECPGASPRDAGNSLSLEEIFAEQVQRLSAPALYGLPIGQGRVQYTLPIGVEARLDADARSLEVLEGATR
jgi:muramoyltetrapeptide carboxypeptidase